MERRVPIRTLRRSLTLFLLLALSWQAQAAEHYRLVAPEEIATFLRQYLPPESDDSAPDDDAERVGLVRRLRQKITELLATQGFFTPAITTDTSKEVPIVQVDSGPVVLIGSVQLTFTGAIQDDPAYSERRDRLREDWSLPEGEPFRQKNWSAAKDRLLLAIASRDFADAHITESLADVDPKSGKAHLSVTVDSGPAYTLGRIEIEGLEDYDEALVARYNPLRAGEPYSLERLLTLQTTLQNTPYFSAVEVEVDRSMGPSNAPVRIRLVEAKPRRANFGLGYSTNTGARVEVGYRNANFQHRAWQLVSALRVEQKRQAAFADVFFPPGEEGQRYSVGGLVEHSDIEGLVTNRQSLGVARTRVRGNIETRVGLSLQREIRKVESSDPDTRQALALNWGWTRRQVDNVLDPRQGHVFSVQFGGGAHALLSDANFIRSYGRVAVWTPVSARNVLAVRVEAGYTATRHREDIPEEFLFRTGGAQTVRGYAYQGLGVKEGNATVGGRYMSAASAELVHWLDERWGVATFVDAGNAADEIAEGFFRPKLGYGIGARWRSPAGPLAVDLAYGQSDKRIRPHISISIAF